MKPLVSCIMPVRGRREFAVKAVRSFLDQTYEPRELIVIQDADAPTFGSDFDSENNFTLVTNPDKWSISNKRNQAIEYARGSYIAHFDSDDWSGPQRLTVQIDAIEYAKLSVCGFTTMMFWDEDQQRASMYYGNLVGSSLIYRRDWWALHPFTDSAGNVGEDNRFVRLAEKHKQVLSLTNYQHMVARIHSDNTSRFKYGSSYRPMDRAQIPAAFFS